MWIFRQGPVPIFHGSRRQRHDMDQEKRTRTVSAPQSAISGPHPPNRVIQVELADDEEVAWTWSTLPGGQRYVSGYTVHKRPG